MRKLLAALLTIVTCIGAAHNANAQADVRLKGAGFELGIVNPEDVNATLGLKGFADLGTLGPNVRTSAQLGYWSSSQDISSAGEASLRDLSIGWRVNYMFSATSSGLRPFAGGGLGLHFLKAKVDVPDMTVGGFFFPGYTIEDSSTKLGLELGGGLVIPMASAKEFIAETWYGVVDGASQFSIHAGMSFNL